MNIRYWDYMPEINNGILNIRYKDSCGFYAIYVDALLVSGYHTVQRFCTVLNKYAENMPLVYDLLNNEMHDIICKQTDNKVQDVMLRNQNYILKHLNH